MPDETWRLGRDLGRVVGLGLIAIAAGWLYGAGPCGDRSEVVRGDPLACLLDADSGYECD
jgi:hypothetical protein